MSSQTTRNGRDLSAAFPIVASLVVAAFAVTNQSLWIDEANSALKAMQPSLQQWWHVLTSEKGSDLQMPLYMLYLWCWEKIAGNSEVALRMSNLPWLIVAHLAFWQASPRSRPVSIVLLAVASVSPFLWFYLDEARPYLMQYGAACVLCVLLFRTAGDPALGVTPTSLWILAIGLLFLCGSSLLGVIWAAFAGAAWLYLVRDQLWVLRQPASFVPLAMAAAVLAALGLYYLWTIRTGGRASDIGRTGLLNLAFILYELVGAAGIGPGRLDIRQHGLAAFRDLGPLLVPLALASFLFLASLAYGLSSAWRKRSHRAVLAGCIYAIPPVLILFALAYAQNFRLLGRHFMPLLPVLIGLFSFALLQLWSTRRSLALGGLIGLLSAWLLSSLSLRFCDRHRKDDYRGAAAAAGASLVQNEIVWWSADKAAAVYYGLPLEPRNGKSATLVAGSNRADLEKLPAPNLVVASKPDIYDAGDQLGGFLREHQFAPVRELPAFTIWRRAADPSER